MHCLCNISHLCRQEELHDFYRLLAVLEQELLLKSADRAASLRGTTLKSALTAKGGDRPKQGSNDAGGEVGGGTAGLTLLRLRAWLQEPIER